MEETRKTVYVIQNKNFLVDEWIDFKICADDTSAFKFMGRVVKLGYYRPEKWRVVERTMIDTVLPF